MKNLYISSARSQVIAGRLWKILFIVFFAPYNFSTFPDFWGFTANAQNEIPGQGVFSRNIVETDIAQSDDFGQSAAIQPDGKIVVAGYCHNDSENDFVLVRYNNNGLPDLSFGVNGKTLTEIRGSNEEAYAVAIQSDGKILVAGEKFNDLSTDFAIMRNNQDGSPDLSFAEKGIATTSIGNSDSYCHSVAVSPSGKIFLAGQSFNGKNWDMAVVCYNKDGSPDVKFGKEGKKILDINNSNDQARSVVVQPDGKIIIGGTSSGKFAIVRLNAEGVPDRSFGKNGIALKDVEGLPSKCNSVCLQKDGKIVAAGWSRAGFAIVRFSPFGFPDFTFGTNGVVSTSLGSEASFGLSVAIDHKERIIVGGRTMNGLEHEFALVRYNKDGTIDNGFFRKVGSEAGFDGRSIVIDKEGDIVAAGSVFNGKNSDIVLVRYSEDEEAVSTERSETGFKMKRGLENTVINVYPNPSSGAFSIKAETAGMYALINEMGKTVEIFRLCDENNFTRHMEYLPGGTYHVIGLNGNKNTLKNVVVVY